MSARTLLFSAALGFLVACSDTTGPSDLVLKSGPSTAPTASPNAPKGGPINSTPSTAK